MSVFSIKKGLFFCVLVLCMISNQQYLQACEFKLYAEKKFDVRGYKDWDPMSSGGSISYADGYEGKAVKIVRTTFGGDAFTCLQKQLPVNDWAGKRIKIEAWVKGEDIIPGKPVVFHHAGHIDFEAFNRNYEPYYPRNWGRFVGTFDWRHVVFEWDIPKDIVQVTLRFGLQGATGAIFFDDIKVWRCD